MITIDAKDKTLGRVASAAAKALLGKHMGTFTKHTIAGEEVKIINAARVRLSGSKTKNKQYVRYSGYPGGQKVETYVQLTARRGEREALRRAVWGMLPKNKLRSRRIQLLTIE
jgi:large subunit ribosomal protein L13